jgi:hypothetical protein
MSSEQDIIRELDINNIKKNVINSFADNFINKLNSILIKKNNNLLTTCIYPNYYFFEEKIADIPYDIDIERINTIFDFDKIFNIISKSLKYINKDIMDKDNKLLDTTYPILYPFKYDNTDYIYFSNSIPNNIFDEDDEDEQSQKIDKTEENNCMILKIIGDPAGNPVGNPAGNPVGNLVGNSVDTNKIIEHIIEIIKYIMIDKYTISTKIENNIFDIDDIPKLDFIKKYVETFKDIKVKITLIVKILMVLLIEKDANKYIIYHSIIEVINSSKIVKGKEEEKGEEEEEEDDNIFKLSTLLYRDDQNKTNINLKIQQECSIKYVDMKLDNFILFAKTIHYRMSIVEKTDKTVKYVYNKNILK